MSTYTEEELQSLANVVPSPVVVLLEDTVQGQVQTVLLLQEPPLGFVPSFLLQGILQELGEGGVIFAAAGQLHLAVDEGWQIVFLERGRWVGKV